MDDWIRTPKSRRLIWAAVVMSLVLGVAFVVVDRQKSTVDQFGTPLTDEQAVEQVVGAARQVIAAALLQDVTGGYSFVSCSAENRPPYRVALYSSFSLPHSDWAQYLDAIASAMISGGWSAAATEAEHFGRKLTRGGVTAVLQRNVDDSTSATMRLYGECRIPTDHRHDDPAWTDVSL